MLQVRCTGARVEAGWKVDVPRACIWAVGKAGDGVGENVFAPYCLVPAVPAWQTSVGDRLSGPRV